MRSPKMTIGLLVLTTLIVLTLASQPASGQTSFQPTDLGTLGGDESGAYAINDYGQIVDRSFDADGEPHVFH